MSCISRYYDLLIIKRMKEGLTFHQLVVGKRQLPFTMALLQVSIEKEGNHPGVITFDEPAQQSIVPEDMKSLIESAIELGKACQIITAITLNSKELIEIITKLDEKVYHRINVEGKAFRRFTV